MAYETEAQNFKINARAASAIQQGQAVGALVAGSQLDESVIPVASGGIAIGVSRASAAVGDAVTVIPFGITKMKAGASLGAYTPLAVGSLAGNVVVPAASAPLSVIGNSLVNAAAGDVIPVFVHPTYL